AAAEVVRQLQRPPARGESCAACPEEADVGMAEAIDRLQLVSDREKVAALQRRQDRKLARIGVLKLVHHQQLEALRPPRAHVSASLEQAAGAQLEVVEVECATLALEPLIGAPEAVEQHVEQPARAPRLLIGGAIATGINVDIERRGAFPVRVMSPASLQRQARPHLPAAAEGGVER